MGRKLSCNSSTINYDNKIISKLVHREIEKGQDF